VTSKIRPDMKNDSGQRMNPPLVFPNPALEWYSEGRTEKVGQGWLARYSGRIMLVPSVQSAMVEIALRNIEKLKDNRD